MRDWRSGDGGGISGGLGMRDWRSGVRDRRSGGGEGSLEDWE